MPRHHLHLPAFAAATSPPPPPPRPRNGHVTTTSIHLPAFKTATSPPPAPPALATATSPPSLPPPLRRPRHRGQHSMPLSRQGIYQVGLAAGRGAFPFLKVFFLCFYLFIISAFHTASSSATRYEQARSRSPLSGKLSNYIFFKFQSAAALL